MKFALFVRFCLFAYTAYHTEKSLDSIKKHVTVRKNLSKGFNSRAITALQRNLSRYYVGKMARWMIGFCLFCPLFSFVYTAYNLDKNYCNIKKCVTVLKIFSWALT